MRQAGRALLVAAMCAAVVMSLEARGRGNDAEVQFQLANLLYEETRFHEARDAYRRAAETDDPVMRMRARIGVVKTALLVGAFEEAEREAAVLKADAPDDAEAKTLHADALWSAGLFDEAEREFREALAMAPGMSRGRHGLAKALASRSKLEDALAEVREALRISPRDGEMHHTAGTILERLHRYEEAAAAYTNYVNLLPNKEKSDKALWSKAQIRFLQAFRNRTPNGLDDESRGRLHTVPFKLVKDKVIVRARVNGGRLVDFVLDTGSEQTTISRQVGQRAGVVPITYTLSAGVGEVGLRGLQLARLDTFEVGTLKLHDVPVLIKNPALKGIPKREMESFSPMALGLSMTIDYGTKLLTIGERLPEEPADITLPLRMHRLVMVRGLINAERPAYFVVDTGGEVISISKATADAIRPGGPIGRRIALRVYGTSGWDRDAFLMQGLNLSFRDIEYRNFSVVVLNLRAPSVLLGFQLGGIVGHKFLSPYRVAMDLDRSELRMTRTGRGAAAVN
ncbi:MAG: retroviral-like aspartic protease family protein [Vicinamibacterales bacterium]